MPIDLHETILKVFKKVFDNLKTEEKKKFINKTTSEFERNVVITKDDERIKME